MNPRKVLQVKAVKEDGKTIDFEAVSRLDTDIDVDYFKTAAYCNMSCAKFLKKNRQRDC